MDSPVVGGVVEKPAVLFSVPADTDLSKEARVETCVSAERDVNDIGIAVVCDGPATAPWSEW